MCFYFCRFVMANLDHTSFRYALFSQVEFKGGSAREASFDGSDLSSSVFKRASVRYASFQYAELTDVDFEMADVFGADFTGIVGLKTLNNFDATGTVNLPSEPDALYVKPKERNRPLPARALRRRVC
uniref:Pentapeptide repeat-containing protein n=1 Tax=Chrysotila carterae TaxID=13221 RepID=A0A7S4BKS9_CHRCT